RRSGGPFPRRRAGAAGDLRARQLVAPPVDRGAPEGYSRASGRVRIGGRRAVGAGAGGGRVKSVQQTILPRLPPPPRRRRSAARQKAKSARVGGLAGIVALSALAAASAGRAQSLPNYVSCPINANALGTSGNPLRGGAVGDFDGNGTPDLALVGSSGLAIALTNSDLFAHGSCPEAITRGTAQATSPTAVAVGMITSDNIFDLALATSGSDIGLVSGDGHGAFTAISSGTRPALTKQRTIAVDKLLKNKPNNEGPDLILGNGNTVVLMFGRTDTTYAVSSTLTLGNNEVKAVRIADF